jgi:glutamate dehydrogenase
MSDFFPTVYHHYGDNHKYINKIIDSDKTFISDHKLNNFVRAFLRHYPLSQLGEHEILYFNDAIKKAYDFFLHQKDAAFQINTFDSKILGESNKVCIIQIFGKDAPFLVDSTLSVIKRRNMKLLRIIRPVIMSHRTHEGDLIDVILKPDLEDKALQVDSFMQLHIQDPENPSYISECVNELTSVMNSVYLAVQDWDCMKKEAENATSFFEPSEVSQLEERERYEFLKKLQNEYFVFIGAAKYKIHDESAQRLSLDNESLLGLMKQKHELLSQEIIKNLEMNNIFNPKKLHIIDIGKLNINSPIHRDTKLDYVCVKYCDRNSGLVGLDVFVGLFTSILYFQSSKLIPLIRLKVDHVLNAGGFGRNSYDGKEIVSIIENLPRDELFRIKQDELADMILEVNALLENPSLRLFARENPCRTSLNMMLFLPDVRFSSDLSEKLEQKLSGLIGAVHTLQYQRLNDSKLGFYHIVIDKNQQNVLIDKKFLAQLEQDLEELTSTWRNKLKLSLTSRLGHQDGHIVYDKFKKAFPDSYKVDFTDQETIYEDISQLLMHQDALCAFKITEVKDNVQVFLKFYSQEEYRLSDIISIIQNFGFIVNYEVVYKVTPASIKSAFIHSFSVQGTIFAAHEIKLFKTRVEDALLAAWQQKTPDDILNQLVISAGLHYRQVMLIRAIVKYLCQIGIGYSKDYICEILIKHPDIISLMLELFATMFDPEIQGKDSEAEETKKKLTTKINKKLSAISNAIEDKVVRTCLDVMLNIVRTNYYIQNTNGGYKEYISLKINSEKMPGLPYPRPFREIFVYSTFFEAIHLRSSKVSRGGIRWSDRTEDFRTEVLGLMKAQVAKNSIIVPTGSKGGFVVKKPTNISAEDYYTLAIECYKNFLRGLLDVTDNIVNGKVINPAQVVRRDDDDPYLVVAADKGTAKFSDFANAVSKEYGYWLGDAFASGGSAGYDHKKIGITARGAWVSVERHFAALGINAQKDEFTVAAIGDMSGDVFGNGLLLSEGIKLVAAFNHQHIFIDPKPDSKISYKERKRLFDLPKSSWADYNQDLLSKGGAVFDRASKTITLSKEIKELFNLQSNEIAPDDLIKMILEMEVDLFWNGGIGTYVKSSNENNIEVGDKSNDSIRINGSQLKCKVFAEGGNLGLTQMGRIEYALSGGHINTDAIDNSAGVDCSDHEVNIKIAFNKALEKNSITLQQRDALLEKMTHEVASLVLQDNYQQNAILTILAYHSLENLSNYDKLIKILENNNYIDRKLEHLPSCGDFALRASNGVGLTKPELSTILASAKNHICTQLLKTDLVDDEYFTQSLMNYFPKDMQGSFASEIHEHPLRKEIIATVVTNNMLNRISAFYPHLASEEMGIGLSDVAKAYVITSEIFETESLWYEIAHLDGKVQIDIQVELFTALLRFTCRASSWLLRNVDLTHKKINIVINEFKNGFGAINDDLKKILRGSAKTDLNQLTKKYTTNGVNQELASKIAMLGALSSLYNIVYIGSKTQQSVLNVAEIYFDIAHRLNYEWLKASLDKINSINDWQRLSVKVYKDELMDVHRLIVVNLIEHYGCNANGIEAWCADRKSQIDRYNNLLDEIIKAEAFDNSMLPLIIQRLYSLLKK